MEPPHIFYAGPAKPAFLEAPWPRPPVALADQPLFDVDLLFIFAGNDTPIEQLNTCKLIERSGRPVIRIGAVDLSLNRDRSTSVLMIRSFEEAEVEQYLDWATERPRTNYESIACNFYDRFEEAITLDQHIHLDYLSAAGYRISQRTGLRDLKTHRGEEFVQLEDRCWLRLDRIVSVDGLAAGDSCRY